MVANNRIQVNFRCNANMAFTGILIVFLLHIWMDFVWLGIVAFLASKSVKIISNRNYKIIILVLSAILIYFGITFLTNVFFNNNLKFQM